MRIKPVDTETVEAHRTVSSALTRSHDRVR